MARPKNDLKDKDFKSNSRYLITYLRVAQAFELELPSLIWFLADVLVRISLNALFCVKIFDNQDSACEKCQSNDPGYESAKHSAKRSAKTCYDIG